MFLTEVKELRYYVVKCGNTRQSWTSFGLAKVIKMIITVSFKPRFYRSQINVEDLSLNI